MDTENTNKIFTRVQGLMATSPTNTRTPQIQPEVATPDDGLSFDMSSQPVEDPDAGSSSDTDPSQHADTAPIDRYPSYEIVSIEDPRNVLIDPRVCSVFRGNPRCNRPFVAAERKELIDSLRAYGNKVPVRARRDPNGGKGFEIYSGAQRLGAALHIQVSDPSFRLLATISDNVSDEEAFAMSEADNAGRSEPPPLLQAQCWAYALKTLYGGSQQKLADAVAKDKSVVSRTLALLQIPDYVLACVDNLDALNPYFAQQLMPALNDKERQPVIELRANELCAKRTRLKPPALVKHLLRAPVELKISSETETLWQASAGGAELMFKDDRQHQAQSYTLKISRALDKKARHEMMALFKAHLDTISQIDPSQ